PIPGGGIVRAGGGAEECPGAGGGIVAAGGGAEECPGAGGGIVAAGGVEEQCVEPKGGIVAAGGGVEHRVRSARRVPQGVADVVVRRPPPTPADPPDEHETNDDECQRIGAAHTLLLCRWCPWRTIGDAAHYRLRAQRVKRFFRVADAMIEDA